ncbi:MAG: FtsX-like permease family protein [Luteitalea sp.]|nr:FtsX-like permease family protein [Luteitalea sp.]
MGVLGYAFDEATTSLWRGRQSGSLSAATVAVALFVLGGFLVATSNLERLAHEWSRAAEMSIYLTDDAGSAARPQIEGLLANREVVAEYEFVSKADALLRFKQMFADLAATADTLGDNPLPASYEVRLQPTEQARSATDPFIASLRATAGVADVRFDREWLDRLIRAVGAVRAVGLILGGVLTVAAALTVANVVRLALYARRDELEIMRLVGAPPAYVDGPFVMEGFLLGGLGAAAGLAALAIVFVAIRGRYLAPLAAAVNLSSVRFLAPELCVLLLLGGMAVGCLGGLVAARGGPGVTRS